MNTRYPLILVERAVARDGDLGSIPRGWARRGHARRVGTAGERQRDCAHGLIGPLGHSALFTVKNDAPASFLALLQHQRRRTIHRCHISTPHPHTQPSPTTACLHRHRRRHLSHPPSRAPPTRPPPSRNSLLTYLRSCVTLAQSWRRTFPLPLTRLHSFSTVRIFLLGRSRPFSRVLF